MPASVDIIRGNALLASGILEKWRFYGDIKFSSRSESTDLPEEMREQRENGRACSLQDKAYSLKDEGASLNAPLKYNPVTALLIQLFPSVGTNLNAQGAGALSSSGTNDKKVKNKEIEIVNVIKGMFIIANDVRRNKGRSKIFDYIRQIEANKANANGGLSVRALSKEYFGLKSGGNKFLNLAKNVANAVLIECEEDHFDYIHTADRYPPYFVNDLISAYAWAALPNAHLGELIEALKTLDDGSSKNQLADWMIKDTPISVVPFLPGEYVISTGKVFLKKMKKDT